MTREDTFYLVQTKVGAKTHKRRKIHSDDEGYLVNKQGYKVLSSNYFNNPEGVASL